MATYNVGNVELGIQAHNDDALYKINEVIKRVDELETKVKIKLNAGFKKTSQRIEDFVDAGKEIKKAFDFGKVYVFFNYLRRYFQVFNYLVVQASDYIETLNKFQVSFGSLYQENLEYVNKINKAYGFSRTLLMDYTSTFNNMLKSLEGLEDKTSATLSRILTAMAIDYSSLFNVSLESTMTAFQAMLSGSIRPIRSQSGFDVSDTTIMALYKNLGGEKSSRELNQLEKRLLRIVAVYNQLLKSGAEGDFAKTINTFSNQLKIFEEQIKELGITWGRFFLIILKPALQFINGLLMAINEIGEHITKQFELMNDFNIDNEFAGMGSAEEQVENVSEAVDKLSGKLLGLDQINILGEGSQKTNSAIDPLIMGELEDALKNYDLRLEGITNKAKEIAETILQWFGYTRNANGELEYNKDQLFKIQDVLIAIISIPLANFISKIGGAIFSTFTILSKIERIKLIGNLSSGLVVFSLLQLILRFNELNDTMKVVYTLIASIGTIIVVWTKFGKVITGIGKAVLALHTALESILKIKNVHNIIELINKSLGYVAIRLGLIIGAVALLATSIFYVLNLDKIPTTIKTIVAVLGTLTSALLVGAGAWMLYHSTASMGTAIPIILAGIAAGIAGISSAVSVVKGIPKLAKGGVLDSPTTVQVAEYAGARRNPEIITPENKMREVFIQSQVPLVNAILGMGNDLKDAFEKSSNKPINLNGRKVSEELYDDFNAVNKRRGGKL